MNPLDDSITNSFHFMCVSCSEHNKLEKPVIVTNTQPTAPKITKKSQDDQPNDSDDDDDDLITPYQQPKSNPSQIVPKESSQPSQAVPNVSSQPSQHEPKEPRYPPNQDPAVPVCSTYKWGRCPNYEQCKFRHPPRCWNWLSAGKCRFNKKCKYHHPPLCKTSVQELKCFNENCMYFPCRKL